jgi:hypothetical protein
VATLPTRPPGPLPAPAGFYPPDTRVGIPPVDRAIAAVVSGDGAEFTSLFQFTEMPCSARFIRPLPFCPDGVPEGTVIPAFRFNQCEGGWQPAERLVRTLPGLLDPPLFVQSVYSREPGIEPAIVPEAEYVLLFGRVEGDDQLLHVWLNASGGIVLLTAQCGGFDTLVIEGRTPILPPLETPSE